MNYLQLDRDFDVDPRCQNLDYIGLWVLVSIGRIAARDWGSVGDVELAALAPESLGRFGRMPPEAVAHGLTQLIASGAIAETPFGVCIHPALWARFGSETMRNRRRAEKKRDEQRRQESIRAGNGDPGPSASPGTSESPGTNGTVRGESAGTSRRKSRDTRRDPSGPVAPTSVGDLLAGFREHLAKRESAGSPGSPGSAVRPTDGPTDRPTGRPAGVDLAGFSPPLPIKPAVVGGNATAVPSENGVDRTAADPDAAAPAEPLDPAPATAAVPPETAPDAPQEAPAPDPV